MEYLTFKNKAEFWNWLIKNHDISQGRYLIFDKSKKTSTLTADEALDCALCFGWIDSIIKKIDDQFYIKYFAKRTFKSIWSTKNKKTVQKLIDEKLMMEPGLKAIELAKKNGRWDKADLPPNDYNLKDFTELLEKSQLAHKNFISFSPSIQKIYAMSYYVLKRIESRERRLKVDL